jgi:hypothetical protein
MPHPLCYCIKSSVNISVQKSRHIKGRPWKTGLCTVYPKHKVKVKSSTAVLKHQETNTEVTAVKCTTITRNNLEVTVRYYNCFLNKIISL